MNLKDFSIIYINLNRRPDKKLHIENQLEKVGLTEKAHRLPAVDGKLLSDEEKEKQILKFMTQRPVKYKDRLLGRIGCYHSHKRALECALEAGVENILILEDDVCFIKKDVYLPELPKDAIMFYLGGLFWKKEVESEEQIAENKKKDWIKIDIKYNKLACAFAYGICGRYNIIKVLEIINKSKMTSIDVVYMNHIQKNLPCYVINPVRCYQTDKFGSDVSFAWNKKHPYNNSYWYDGVGQVEED